MSLCAIIGDSIALGLALAAPQCDRNAVKGRDSYTIAQQRMPENYKWAVISSGSNSLRDPQLRKNLYTTRKKLNAQTVVWVVPVNPRVGNVVRIVAKVWGDPVVTFVPGKDGVHPKSYKVLYKNIKKVL